MDDMWTKCGQSVVEVWSLKVWESVEKVDLRGSEEARGPGPLGALGPGPLGAPRASSDPRKSTFSALSQTFNGHTSTTLCPHIVHIPQKSTFRSKFQTFPSFGDLLGDFRPTFGKGILSFFV